MKEGEIVLIKIFFYNNLIKLKYNKVTNINWNILIKIMQLITDEITFLLHSNLDKMKTGFVNLDLPVTVSGRGVWLLLSSML